MSIAGRFYLARKFYRSLVKPYKFNDVISLSPEKKSQSLFPLLNLEKIQTDLQEDGVALRVDLPTNTVDSIQKFAMETVCYGDRKGKFGFLIGEKQKAEEKYDQFFQQAQYVRPDLENCSAIRKIENDPVIRAIARQYLGTEPVHLTSRLFWSFADKKAVYDHKLNSTHYHYDLDDFGCIRFFFYITDVTSNSGPHVYMKGSHKRKSLYQKLVKSHAQRTDREIVDYYGEDKIVMICGPKGSGFAQDSMCFHKATRPEKTDRLLLQITFAINDYHMHGEL